MASKNDLVTKSYLKSELGEFEKRIKNDLLVIKEGIVGEIKDMREEFDVHQASHSRINDEIKNHEERITTLEQKPL